jgi:DNA phosphorothioation-dependent restriction protein DptG
MVLNTWKVLKCGAGERWEKNSWTDCVRKDEVLQRVKQERNILHTIKRGRLTELVTSCIGTVY